MNEELIIDGRRVDMSPDTRIVLNFKSNLLGDVSKITASNSQTISLPKTTRNREIFDHATAPAYSSGFRYRKHAAEYSRNGVKIISDAYALLLDSADNYEIALYWGEMTKFQSWVNSGLKISDLDFSNIYQIWKSPPTIATCYNGSTPDEFYYPDDDYLYYVDYDCGLGSVETMPESVSSKITLHPVMSVRRLLLKIQEEAGIKFEFPAGFMDRKDSTAASRSGIFQGLAIPMLTRKDASQQTKTLTITGWHSASNSMQRYAGIVFTAPASEHYELGSKKYDMFFGKQVEATTIKFKNAGHVKMSILINVQIATKWINRNWVETPVLELGINGDIKMVPCRYVGGFKEIGRSPGWRYHSGFIAYDYEADIDEGHELSLLVEMGKDSEFYRYDASTATPFSPNTVTVTPPQAEINISLGEYFRVNGNLPDVGQVDLIKALSAMYGLSVVPSGKADTLKFIRLDDLFNNRANAVDWSDKMIASGGGEPDRVKFSFGEYAQKNNFRYAEDTTVQTTGEGSFYINNESLDASKDVITLPFAASDETVVKTKDGIDYKGAIVPIYKKNEDGEIEMNTSLKPRILKIVSDGTVESTGNKAIGRFLPITFSELLSRYYGVLSNVVNNALTITENFRLDEFDLLNLDFTKPVYLKQYGRYYGIVSVQTNDGYCAVELLQFPVGDAVTPTLLYSINGGGWLVNLHPWSGSLKAKTVFGGIISTEDISNFGAVMSGPEMGILDLRECDFLGNTLFIASTPVGDRYSLEYVSELYLPKGIQRISERAFEISRGVREYHFQPGLKEIAYMAFSYNYALEVVEFPEGIEKIGGYAFYMCQKLATIIFNNPIPPQIVSDAFSQMGQTIPEGTPKRIIIPSGTYALYSTVEAFSYLISGQGYVIEER